MSEGKQWKTSRKDMQSYRASDGVPVVYVYREGQERVQVAGDLCREDGELMAAAPLLLAALEPFAAMIFTAMYEHASDETVVYATETRAGHFEITVGDFRRARTAIQAATAKGGSDE